MVLVAEPKQVVAPGELLAEGDHLLGDNAYKIGTQIYSACIGILEIDGNRVFVVPLKGGYFPRAGDLVGGLPGDEHRHDHRLAAPGRTLRSNAACL